MGLIVDIEIVDKRLLESGNEITYATEGSAAFDVRACCHEAVTIEPGTSFKFELGFKMAIPDGYAALLMPRSGSGSRGRVLANTIGLIDFDYRGVVIANLMNKNESSYIVEPMERIGQMVLVPVARAEFNIVEKISETARGEGGFGSTGTK